MEKSGLEGEVVLDDREDSPGRLYLSKKLTPVGFRMNDARFLGFPFTIVVGKSWKQEGKLELQIRKSGQKMFVTKEELVSHLRSPNV